MTLLKDLYDREKERLLALSEKDDPCGEYAYPVFGIGNTAADVLLIGEAPGAEETKKSTPFVGKAGKQLDELLELAGIERSDIYITNVVKYRPVKRKTRTVSNRTPSIKEILTSIELLKKEISIIEPALIVTLGNTPLKAVSMMAQTNLGTIGDCHGRPVSVSIEGKDYTVIALYHPASVIYNRTLIDVLKDDAVKMGRFAKTIC